MRFTLLIQGRLEEECLLRNLENFRGAPVVVSTWEGENLPLMDSSVVVVKSKVPDEHGIGNFMLQLVSTLEGARRVETEFVIKIRGDEFFNYGELMKRVENKPDVIFFAPIFFKSFDSWPYHISDHIMAGTTEHIRSMFSTAKSKYERTLSHDDCKEWGLTKAHMINMGFDRFENLDLGKAEMKRLFDVVDLNDLKDYRITVNSWGRKYYNDFVPSHCGGIDRIEDL